MHTSSIFDCVVIVLLCLLDVGICVSVIYINTPYYFLDSSLVAFYCFFFMLATYVGLWKSVTIMGRRYLLTHLTASYIVACCCFLQTWDVRICCFNEPTYLNTLKRVVAQWYSQRISVLEVAGSVPAPVIVELLWLKILCEFIHQTWFRNNWMSDCRPPGNNRQTA